MTAPRFKDRRHAGQVLAGLLASYAGRTDLMVLALPRGGVPVGFEVAGALRAPLDVFLVRKIGVPGYRELAMGAIASGGIRVINAEVTEELKIPQPLIERATREAMVELHLREQAYRPVRPELLLQDRTLILVDDGLATGATMRAGVAALRVGRPRAIVVAVPVGSMQACELVRREVDQLVCAAMPDPFHAVGMAYEDFEQTRDEEVRALLAAAQAPPPDRTLTP